MYLDLHLIPPISTTISARYLFLRVLAALFATGFKFEAYFALLIVLTVGMAVDCTHRPGDQTLWTLS